MAMAAFGTLLPSRLYAVLTVDVFLESLEHGQTFFLPPELRLIRLMRPKRMPTRLERRSYDANIVHIALSQSVLSAKVQIADRLGIKAHEVGCDCINGNPIGACNGHTPVHPAS